VIFIIQPYIKKIVVMKYFGPKNALAKYFLNVLKNCTNENCSNKIRIRGGLPVLTHMAKQLAHFYSYSFGGLPD
jgi:hypothetical protein